MSWSNFINSDSNVTWNKAAIMFLFYVLLMIKGEKHQPKEAFVAIVVIII